MHPLWFSMMSLWSHESGDQNHVMKNEKSRFADDTKLCSWHTWRVGCHPHDGKLEWVKKWGLGNHMRFDRTKSKAPHLGQDNAWYQQRVRHEQIEHSSVQKELGCCWMRGHDPARCTYSPESQLYPGPVELGRWFSPSALVRLHLEHRKDINLLRKATKMIRGMEHLSYK